MCDQFNQGASDPWGSITTANTDYLGTYDFSVFKDSKSYLDNQSSTLRKALLQYFYNERQSDVKKWLADPGMSDNIANYLGFPDQRNVSLFPEWDAPLDSRNFQNVMTEERTKSAEATWWMWLEGVSNSRPYSYVPGGVPSTEDSTDTAFLDKRYQQGYGDSTGGNDNAEYFTITCSKRFQIVLPQWCTDYDILADYANCTPFTASIAKDSTANGVGGISINKGPVVTVNGQNTATFTVNSVSNPLPAYNQGMINAGRIMDQYETPGGDHNSLIQQRLYEWLSYSVVTPQFEQTRYGTGTQKETPNNTRSLPKIGASYYPTVGFKVIGFEKNPIFNNLSRTSTLAQGTGTYIPAATTVGRHNDLLGVYAPVYPRSFIDLTD
tara:strand:- start:326 stop:1468 length:1143 start_codon:yes stop_codon:yes gene_type:complete